MGEKTRHWDKKRAAKAAASIKEKTARLHDQDEQKHQERRQGRKPKYTSSKCFAYMLANYFAKCDNTIIDPEKSKTEPYTLTGLQLAVGVAGSGYQRYKNGEANYIVDEHTTYNGSNWIEINISDREKALLYEFEKDQALQPYFNYLYDSTDITAIYFSSIYQKARLLVQDQAEKRLYINGRVADIFTLKSKYGWQEEQTTRHVVQIASPEDAKQALEALKLLDD